MLKYTSLILTAAALSACASTPDVTYKYFLSTSKTIASVTQTFSCNQLKRGLVTTYATPQVSTVNAADYSHPVEFKPGSVDSSFADSDFSFNLFDDGRLKSINASWTGQGETILKSAISLGVAAVGVGGAIDHTDKNAPSPCDVLNKWSPDGKSVSLTYNDLIDERLDSDSKAVEVDSIDLGAKMPLPRAFTLGLAHDKTMQDIRTDLKKIGVAFPPILFKVVGQTAILGAAAYDSCDPAKGLCLTLQKTKRARYQVTVGGDAIAAAAVIVPDTDATAQQNTYTLPILKAALFGKQSFALTLNDAGAITTIDYGKLTGAAGPLNVAASAATAATPTSTGSTGSTETTGPTPVTHVTPPDSQPGTHPTP